MDIIVNVNTRAPQIAAAIRFRVHPNYLSAPLF